MPLVDYASSDEGSNGESEIEEENKTKKKMVLEGVEVKGGINKDKELFSVLPKPRKTFSFLEDDNKLSNLLLNKNSVSTGRKENVKISVPSISEFVGDAEEPAPKKVKPSCKGAGLFSILPPPKNTTANSTLIPLAVSENQVKQTINKAATDSKNVISKLMKVAKVGKDDDDDEITVGSSFFGSSLTEQSLNSEFENVKNEHKSLNKSSDNCIVSRNSFVPQQMCDPGLRINADKDKCNYSKGSLKEPDTVSFNENPFNLDEKALQILCGNKKKRQQMPMKIIDLSGEEVLPDSKKWLLKQFTEEKKRSHSHKKNFGPSSQSRRKHQITYLAYQAKEQELELQNQWANNRMSRKQTQSKYGF